MSSAQRARLFGCREKYFSRTIIIECSFKYMHWAGVGVQLQIHALGWSAATCWYSGRECYVHDPHRLRLPRAVTVLWVLT